MSTQPPRSETRKQLVLQMIDIILSDAAPVEAKLSIEQLTQRYTQVKQRLSFGGGWAVCFDGSVQLCNVCASIKVCQKLKLETEDVTAELRFTERLIDLFDLYNELHDRYVRYQQSGDVQAMRNGYGVEFFSSTGVSTAMSITPVVPERAEGSVNV
jgi:hypothetical protein